MRLRAAANLPERMVRNPEKKLWKEEFSCTTITPVYGGGVNAGEIDKEMPIRVAAIRGQLRFWWRLLRKYDDPTKPLQDDVLFEEERSIWGGMAKDNQDYSSKVRIYIKSITKQKIISNENYTKIGQKYALFPARDNHAQLLGPGITIGLQVTCHGCDEEERQRILRSVRWWATFGGIGARTRRGLGAIEVKSFKPVTEDEAQEFGCELRRYPCSFKSGLDAWDKAVWKLQHFRQGIGLGRKSGRTIERNGRKVTLPGRSYWPEPDSIRQITKKIGHPLEHDARISFPRAAFGMPIIFEIRGNGEPPKTELRPAEHERMASPLILKPIPNGHGEYVPIALLLPTNHLDDLELVLKNNTNAPNHYLPHSVNRNDWWPIDHVEAAEKADYGNSPMKKNNGHDALSAFLNYFQKGY